MQEVHMISLLLEGYITLYYHTISARKIQQKQLKKSVFYWLSAVFLDTIFWG